MTNHIHLVVVPGTKVVCKMSSTRSTCVMPSASIDCVAGKAIFGRGDIFIIHYERNTRSFFHLSPYFPTLFNMGCLFVLSGKIDSPYTDKEYTAKLFWTSSILKKVDADVIAFQELWSMQCLEDAFLSVGDAIVDWACDRWQNQTA